MTPEVWFDFDCPVTHVDMDLEPPPEPGETFRCSHCGGEHIASTEIGEWLTYGKDDGGEQIVTQAGGRYPIA